jgi:hypothetical protein
MTALDRCLVVLRKFETGEAPQRARAHIDPLGAGHRNRTVWRRGLTSYLRLLRMACRFEAGA